MKELELLKRDWKSSENSFQQVSETQIYKMIHKNSSSVVKWIMIIGIIEFVFWIGINFFTNSDDYFQKLDMENIMLYMKLLTYFNYCVIVVFIYLFYRNYVLISTTDSTKVLMKNILRTRRTVNIYVWYNLSMFIVCLILGVLLAYFYNPEFAVTKDKIEHNGIAALVFVGITVVVVGIMSLIFWLFYKLLYGILMSKLYKNYQELKKIDL